MGARRGGGRGRRRVHRASACVTGSIWGRITWGTYWDWDPRITSTTLLFMLLVGYLALRRIDNEAGDAAQRGMRGAIVGLLLFPNVMIVHYSVDWWRSLHQTATITRLDPTIEGTMLFTLMLGIVVFGLVFAWLLVHRFRLGWLEERAGATGLDEALVERRAEAGVVGPDRRPGVIAMTHVGLRRRRLGHRPRQPRRLRAAHRPPRSVPGGAGAAGGASVELSPRTAPGPGAVTPRRRRSPWAYGALVLVLARHRRGRLPGPHLGVAVLLQRRRSGRADGTTSATSASGCRASCATTSPSARRDGVTFTITFNGVDVPRAPRRRPARAVPARHPRRARGPLGASGEVFASDRILVKHSEQYEADNGDRLDDAEDAETGEPVQPVNATLGTAGVVLGVAASALGIVTLAVGLRRQRPAAARDGLELQPARAARRGRVRGRDAARADHPRLLRRLRRTTTARAARRALFNVATMWSALEGSILLWALILAGFTVHVARKFRQRLSDPLVGVGPAHDAGRLPLLLPADARARPTRSAPSPWPPGYDGPGPNPLLQEHILMAVHPPMLYLGYVGFTVPFAFAIAALATGSAR